MLSSPFWSPRLQINAEKAIFHQWQMLEDSGCIDNFRLVAGEKEGFRNGWFFADSDAYKWLEAASLTLAPPDPQTCQLANVETCKRDNAKTLKLVNDFIGLIKRTQCEDGYIYTYNQIHFPASRWDNLMIEHELYCHGHLIEACIAHYEATGETTALDLARRDRDCPAAPLPGHRARSLPRAGACLPRAPRPGLALRCIPTHAE
jgi:DUF1680 family protein